MRRLEASLRRRGYTRIAGVDEAGRGPLAGPVVAAAVVLRRGCRLAGVDDSKRLSETQRLYLFDAILDSAEGIGLGIVTPNEIDRSNILRASWQAMLEAVRALHPPPQMVLVDGWPIPGLQIAQRGIVHGDQQCASIAAASIVAKVARDRLMHSLDSVYPGYGFAQHKGYATLRHIAAMRHLGICPVHRKSFGPVVACQQRDITMP